MFDKAYIYIYIRIGNMFSFLDYTIWFDCFKGNAYRTRKVNYFFCDLIVSHYDRYLLYTVLDVFIFFFS